MHKIMIILRKLIDKKPQAEELAVQKHQAFSGKEL